MRDQPTSDQAQRELNPGKLYIVATPIGNLDDISYRAVEVLRQVELIVVEDKRQSLKLLQHFNIQGSTYTLHDHNERENSTKLVKKLQEGSQIALISDAGTPLISDPGYVLVNTAISSHIPVVPIPGASAVITALSVSGLPTDRFCFEGFLPAKAGARVQRLKALGQEGRTIIFYEAPHRIVEMLTDLIEVFGADRLAVLARELTKTFETVQRLPLGELCEWVKNDTNQQKGEIVVLLQGKQDDGSGAGDHDRVLESLLEVLPLKQAVNVAVKITGAKKNKLYERALELKSSD